MHFGHKKLVGFVPTLDVVILASNIVKQMATIWNNEVVKEHKEQWWNQPQCRKINNVGAYEQALDLGGKWEMIYNKEDMELPSPVMGQNYSIEVVKLIKLLLRVGRSFSKGFQQVFQGVKLLVGVGGSCSTNNSVMVMAPLVYHWDPGGLKRRGGIQVALNQK